MGVIGKRLGIREVYLSGCPLRVDDFEQSCAAALVCVEPGFEHAVGILEHAAAKEFKTLDRGLVAGVSVENVRRENGRLTLFCKRNINRDSHTRE